MHRKRKEKTTPFGVNVTRSPVLYRAAPGAPVHIHDIKLIIKKSALQPLLICEAMQTHVHLLHVRRGSLLH